MNDLHKFDPLQFYEQSSVSLEGFEIRKDDYTWAKELVLILVTSKSEQRCHNKAASEGFLSNSNHLLLFYRLKLNLKIKL